jgi:hypothetical protein
MRVWSSVEAQLQEHRGDVGLHCPFGHYQTFGDASVGQALGDK